MQQEIADIHMNDPVAAHIKLIHGKHVFRIVILNILIRTELSLLGLFGGQHIAYLNIDAFAVLVTNEIDRLCAVFADRYLIAETQQFQTYDVFQDQLNIPLIVSVSRLSQAVIGKIIFLINSLKDTYKLEFVKFSF